MIFSSSFTFWSTWRLVLIVSTMLS